MNPAASTSRWFRFNLWLHRWTGLLATVPFLVLCLTGTVLIFHEEIDAALGVVPAAAQAGAPMRPWNDSVARVGAAFPEERVLSAGVEPDEYPGVLLVATAPAGERSFDHARFHFTDLASARLLGEVDFGKTFTGWLLELHAQWFLGPVGELVGALIAALVLLSLFSGLVVYAPYVKRIAFGVVRRNRGTRQWQLDLHNFVGVVVLGWALVVTITGFLLGFGTVAQVAWQMTELTALQEEFGAQPVDPRQPPADIDRAVAAAQAAAPPGWRGSTVVYPDTEFSTNRHYSVLLVGPEDTLDERLFRIALVDAATGQVATVRELPSYLKAIVVSQPLHFGDYGGLPLKLLWTACAWLTLFITANGAWLWWDRRRRYSASRPEDIAA